MKWIAALACAALLGCSAAQGTLARGQGYYEDNRFEQALSVWRELARTEPELSPEDRARYAYLRGMTDYRLGFRDEARHWLGLAKARQARHPGGMAPTWMTRLEAALDDLNREIFGIRAASGDPVQLIEAPPAEALPPEALPPEALPASDSPAELPADPAPPASP